MNEDTDDGSSSIMHSLQLVGFSVEKNQDGKFPVITASRKDGDREVSVRMELTTNPLVTLRYKNGFSMKYLLSEDAINKSLKALQALDSGKPFSSLWDIIMT